MVLGSPDEDVVIPTMMPGLYMAFLRKATASAHAHTSDGESFLSGRFLRLLDSWGESISTRIHANALR